LSENLLFASLGENRAKRVSQLWSNSDKAARLASLGFPRRWLTFSLGKVSQFSFRLLFAFAFAPLAHFSYRFFLSESEPIFLKDNLTDFLTKKVVCEFMSKLTNASLGKV
jgi:hypothetical protein